MTSQTDIKTPYLLIVSQDLDVADVLEEVLTEANYETRQVHSLAEAEFIRTDANFDLAILDGELLEHNYEAFQRLLSDGLFLGNLMWVVVIVDVDLPQITEHAHGVAYLYEPRPKFINAIARVLDRSTAVTSLLSDLITTSQIDQNAQRMFERKIREHQTLSSLARMLNSTLDPTNVLTKIVDAATSLTNAEEGLLLLPDDDGKELYIRAAKGMENVNAQEFRIKTDDTLAGQVFITGTPVLVGNAGPQKLKTAYFVKSLLYVPMLYKNQVIGVLGVNNRESDHPFNVYDRSLLLDLASHAAIAIENARLYGESVLRSRELSILYKVSQIVNSTLALDEVVSIIVKQLVVTLDVGWCEIATLDKKDGQLKRLASYRQAEWVVTNGDLIKPVNFPMMHETAQKRQRTIVASANVNVDSPEGQYLEQYNGQVIVYYPLLTSNRTIGVFELLYTGNIPRQSTAISMAYVQQTAIQMMITIEKTSIFNREIERTIQELKQETGADFFTLYMWDEKQEKFYRQWSLGEASWAKRQSPIIENNHLFQSVLDDEDYLRIIRSELDDNDARNLIKHYDAQSILLMPLIIAGGAEGVVVLADPTKSRSFSQRKINMARTLIIQAANAIKNASLYHDLQQSMEDLRHAQSQLIQAARLSAMGELAAAVAHQINNPLTTVIADTQMILQDMDESHRDYESLQAVNRSGKRAHEVVRRLLGMARQSEEDEPPILLDINQTIENTMMLLSKHIEQHHIKLKQELADDLPMAYALSSQLEDVWMNLLLNARDAVANCSQPAIGIRSQYNRDTNMIEVTVWDNGTGIPEDKREKIFEAFFTTKSEGEGTGLGLHICRQIVEKCNGEIVLQSTNTKGTSFVVMLPVTN